MSTITRTLSNLRKIGLKNYIIQMVYIGDTKHGRFVGQDRAGNKYYENTEEYPLRTRWVDYNKHDYDAGQIEPGWHGWISYMVDKPPTEDPVLRTGNNKWDLQKAVPNLTATSGNYITYSTTKPKVMSWEPKAVERQ